MPAVHGGSMPGPAIPVLLPLIIYAPHSLRAFNSCPTGPDRQMTNQANALLLISLLCRLVHFAFLSVSYCCRLHSVRYHLKHTHFIVVISPWPHN